ncbi:baseplate complex protein [Pseudomonas graminis]
MTSTATFALDGEGILLKSIRITLSMAFEEKDQSGQTSSTATAEQGIKAKELRVSGLIPFSEPEVLKRIFELASARDSGGKLKVYRIACLETRSVNFREGSFTGNIDAPRQDKEMAWLVTFTIKERLSVDEKKQARASGKITATKQGASGAGAGGGVAAAEDEEKMTWFERKVLQPVNDSLG